MVGVLDLPCELLIQIFRDLGADLKVYSAKERQTDLARLATVCRAFHAATIPLLYSDAVTCRSAGRTFLLDRALLANPDLRPLVRTLVLKSELDNGHVSSLTSILRHTPSLESLALASCFFEADSGFAPLLPTLSSATHIQHFAYGFGSRLDRLLAIQHLLPRWPQLRSLCLNRVDAQGLSRVQPQPSYRLRIFEINNNGALLPGTNDHSCDAHDLDWLLGDAGFLESLSIVYVDVYADASKILHLVAERGHAATLRRLTLRGLWSTHHDDAPFDPNDLRSLLPNLIYVELEDYDDTRGPQAFAIPSPHFKVPSTLRTLVLHTPLERKFRLLQSLQSERPPNLRKIKIIGAYPTAVEIKRLQARCEELGIIFEVERSF